MAAAQPTLLQADSPGSADSADRKVELRPDSSEEELFRVRIEFGAEGNVNLPDDPLVSRDSRVRLPMKTSALFDYEERFRRPRGAHPDSYVTYAERYYHEAKNIGTVNRNEIRSELRPSVRSTVVRRETLPEVIYAADDYFRQEELELIRLPASSVAIESLLPADAVAVGSTYEIDKDVLASVLNLTSIESSGVTAEVKSIVESEAKIQFRGKVEGSVDGVPTVMHLLGKLTFDRVLRMSTWLAMAIHETREIGRAEPGFDVKATVRMLRKPLQRTIALDAKPAPIDLTLAIPEERLYVESTSRELGFSVLMDRRWRMMRDVPGAAMMRMIDDDRSVAQCDFKSLATLQPGAQWTLEAFTRDVRQTLGDQLRDLIEADQRVSDGGLRVLRVTAAGAVQGVPIQWVLLHFSDDHGRRLLATFTMEAGQAAEFAGADLQLASSLRLVERSAAEAGPKSRETADRGDSPQARLARRSANSENAKSEKQVQSASDVR